MDSRMIAAANAPSSHDRPEGFNPNAMIAPASNAASTRTFRTIRGIITKLYFLVISRVRVIISFWTSPPGELAPPCAAVIAFSTVEENIWETRPIPPVSSPSTPKTIASTQITVKALGRPRRRPGSLSESRLLITLPPGDVDRTLLYADCAPPVNGRGEKLHSVAYFLHEHLRIQCRRHRWTGSRSG